MKNKNIYAVGFSLVLLLSIAFMVRVLSGPEDSWICVDGKWQRHGNPIAIEPDRPCK